MAARQDRSRPRRRAQELRPRLLIATEGKVTEPQYLEALRQLDPFRATVSKIVGVGKDPESVVKRCIAERDAAAQGGDPFQLSVCLVDADSHARLGQACQLARTQGIFVLISNVKFEVWLRWHVASGSAPLTSDQLDRFMSTQGLTRGKHLAPQFPAAYFKNASAEARQADPNMAPGRLGRNPSTALPLLVEWMSGRLPRTAPGP